MHKLISRIFTGLRYRSTHPHTRALGVIWPGDLHISMEFNYGNVFAGLLRLLCYLTGGRRRRWGTSASRYKRSDGKLERDGKFVEMGGRSLSLREIDCF